MQDSFNELTIGSLFFFFVVGEPDAFHIVHGFPAKKSEVQ